MGLDSVEIVMELEERFRITIPDADAERAKTVGDLADCVLRRRAIEGQVGEIDLPHDPALAHEFAVREVSRICADVVGIDPDRVTADSRLVEDLGCD